MSRNAFVTGASGFIGNNLVKKLLSEGWNVIGLTRHLTSNYFSHQNLSIVEGDILDQARLIDLTRVADVIFHCAAHISFSSKDFKESFSINVMGTENILKSALKNKVKKVVYLSAASVLGYTKDPEVVIDEDRRVNISKTNSYAFTKRMAEDLVQDYVRMGLDASIAKITTVYGAGDKKLNSGTIIKSIYKDKIRFAPAGGTSYVSIADLVRGLLILSERGKKGESYTFCSENLTFLELFNRIAKCLGRKPIKAVLPRWTLFPVQGAFFLMRPFFGYSKDRVNILTPEIIKESYSYKYYSGKKARKELCWEPEVFLEEAVMDALRFYLKEGLV